MRKNLRLLLGMIVFICMNANAQFGIGTNDPKGAFDITSSTNGLLVPRMNTTQRDAITLPANALLIYNTTNNSFEVFKTTCSCWVTVYDGGNSAASSLVNTPPSANNLIISGRFMVGKTATFGYTYEDDQNDPQGLTSIEWQRASTNSGNDAVTIAGATGASYTFQAGDLASYIRARVFPRAATGVLNGVVTTTGWTLVEESTTPTANSLVVLGTTSVGSTLSASYTFAGGNGIENTTPPTPEGVVTGTSYVWQYANTATGEAANNVNTYGVNAYTSIYTPQNDLLGKFIRVAVKAKDTNSLQAINWVFSPWVGPLTATAESAPVASNVTYSPAPAVALVHTGSYTYYDINFDPEGATTFQWYRADDATGAGAQAISGATSNTYTAAVADANKFLGFGVTVKAQTGTTTGTEVIYYNPYSVLPKAEFTFTGNIKKLPFFHAGRLMNAQNTVQVEVNVTTAGGMSVSSDVVNGYSFAGNFTLATGTQYISIAATGTQTAFDSMGDIFTLTGVGITSQTTPLNIDHEKLGADYTTHYNGWVSGANDTPNAGSYTVGETFNNNSNCTAKVISTSTCPVGNTVTGVSGTVYTTVSINGQCWMARNLREIPSSPCADNPNTGCNIWLGTTPDNDVGYWGYFNETTQNGTAGWAATAPGADYGLLYQWSAAMNGATHERAQGNCPDGWHIPSDCEFKYLEHGIGSSITANNTVNSWRFESTNFGTKLKSTTNGGTNTVGFNNILKGFRNIWGGTFNNSGSHTVLWTSSQNGAGAARRSMDNGVSGIYYTNNEDKRSGFSVRCLRD